MIQIVLDASVAKSCSDPAYSDEAAKCFLYLAELRSRELGLIVNEVLEAEWDKHGSRTFRKWRVRMESRNRVKRVSEKRSADYRVVVGKVDDEGIRVALEKDFHLVELALLGRHPVASRDDKQRRYVRDLVPEYAALGAIQWMNPVTDLEVDSWFERGCDSASFLLGQAA